MLFDYHSYRDELYHGKWYVDCSNGGAVHGKGMYAVYNKGISVTENMKQEIIGYGGYRDLAYVETFTVDKSAKFIKEDEIKNHYSEYGRKLVSKYFSEYDFSDDEVRFVAGMIGVSQEDSADFVSKFMATEKAPQTLMKIDPTKSAEVLNEFIQTTSDNGVFCSLLGYDGIKCSGNQNYIVILNRTKIIFKGGK